MDVPVEHLDATAEAAGPEVVVRRRGGLLAGVGVVSAALCVAYLDRSAETGSPLDWALTVLLGLIAAVHLAGFVDARVPLLVADARGARVRSGRHWRGVVWEDLERIEHTPRGLWRDGRLVLVAPLEEPLTVSLGLATRASGGDHQAVREMAALAAAAGRPVEVLDPSDDAHREVEAPEDVVTEPATPTLPHEAEQPEQPAVPGRGWRDPRPVLAQGIGSLAARLRPATAHPAEPVVPAARAADAPSVVASPTPAPLREVRPGRRAEVTLGALALDPVAEDGAVVLPEAEELRRSPWDAEGSDWAEHPTEVVEPLREPVVGPVLAGARRRLSLGVEELAERTRIRPHVIEAIEVDDFAPCGGDFYARGHLRTLARVLGVDVAPLLASYDELYAHAPVSPRRVFEAELGSGSHGSLRGTRGGPNWSVLVAAVMAVVLAWSLARIVMDGPVELRQVPGLAAGSGGIHQGGAPAGAVVPVLVRAAGGGAHVVVRDGNGKIALAGDLAYGDSRSLKVVPPVRVETSDGSVEVVVDGRDQGKVGATGQPATATYVAD